MSIPWLERLFSVFRGSSEESFDQRQREALVDLLVWTMFVDRHVGALEQESMQEEAAGLPWESPRPVEIFMDGSVRRIREVLGDAEAEGNYLAEIAGRLTDSGVREQAYAACERLARVDGQLSPRESDLLERIRTTLDVKKP